jgi:hypothetical protein
MKTVLITGGASGLGKGIATQYLKKGDKVIAIGSSTANGNTFLNEAKQFGAEGRAIFIQANLSLVSENQRIVEEIKRNFPVLDALIFCAGAYNKEYTETIEGFGFSFVLAYLSRFILSYRLKECLDKTDNPIILNICGTGMKGEVNWNDLQYKNCFDTLKVANHCSRMNDLSGVEFTKNDTVGKIKYILYNPMAVKTPGIKDFGGTLMKVVIQIIGKSIEKAVVPIMELLDNPPKQLLTSITIRKENSLSMEIFDKNNAQKLFSITTELLEGRSK